MAGDGTVGGLWGSALDVMRQWDSTWADAVERMSVNPWRESVLDDKFVELVCIALNACCITLDAEAVRRHIRAAVAAGATRDEVVFVVKCATVVSIHSMSVAAPILLDEGGPFDTASAPTPACDAMRAAGQWNVAWDPFLRLDPAWTDEFMAVGADIYSAQVLTTKEVELLSIALDAAVGHLYVPGIRRHIGAALDAGATPPEILSVLKLCVAQGVQACNLAIPIIDDEFSHSSDQDSQP